MAVLYWQIVVAVSVVACNAIFSRRVAFWVCIGWTLWSLIAISLPVLAILQSLVAWGTYAVVGIFRRSAAKVDELRTQVSIQTEDNKRISDEADRAGIRLRELEGALLRADAPARLAKIVATPRKRNAITWEMIDGQRHVNELHGSLRDAGDWICITSGWLGAAALDNRFLASVEHALQNGTKVYLAYGWQSSDGKHSPSASTKAAFEALRTVAARQYLRKDVAVGHLCVAIYPNHEKLLVTPRLVIAGSYNWLSNSQLHNAERSILIRDPALAAVEGRRLRQLIARDAVPLRLDDFDLGRGVGFGLCVCGSAIQNVERTGWWDDVVESGHVHTSTCESCKEDLICEREWNWRRRSIADKV